MKGVLNESKNAFRTVFSHGNYLFLSFLLFVVFSFLFVAIQIYTMPGRLFNEWLAITTPADVLFILLLSLGLAVLASMQAFVFTHDRKKKIARKTVGLSLAAIASGVVSTVFASATCAACLGFLISILGIPAFFFLVSYRWYVAMLGVLLVLYSIHLVAKRVNNDCEECNV